MRGKVKPIDLKSITDHVNAQRCTRYDDRGKQLFEAFLPCVVATFILPQRDYGENQDQHEAIDNNAMLAAVNAAPFPCVRIRRRITSEVSGHCECVDTDVIVAREGDDRWLWAAKDTQLAPKLRVLYTPNTTDIGRTALTGGCPASLPDLITFLDDRRNRYIEQPVSRQVRRAEGVSPDYKEFIVIRKPPASLAKGMLRLGEVFRRSPKLHAVRGHLRHYRADRYTNARGKVQFIEPFARGAGDMLQVKDYAAEETRYVE